MAKGQFEKGNRPWNYATKGVCRPNSGTFRKGHAPNETSFKPAAIGTIMTRKDGYRYLRTATGWEYIRQTGRAVRSKRAEVAVQEKPVRPEIRIVTTIEEYNRRSPYSDWGRD